MSALGQVADAHSVRLRAWRERAHVERHALYHHGVFTFSLALLFLRVTRLVYLYQNVD